MKLTVKESFLGFSKQAIEKVINDAPGKPVNTGSKGPNIGHIVGAKIVDEKGNDFIVEFELEVIS